MASNMGSKILIKYFLAAVKGTHTHKKTNKKNQIYNYFKLF